VGTGGTICGTSKYLKEQNADIVSVGIDTYGSVFKKYKETGEFDEGEIYPYLTEGIGEDILPKNVDFSMIDTFVKVTDKDSAIMTRRLAREEGLFIGWSCGAAVYGALEYARENLKEDDTMVIILPDHGTRYLAKVYNDEWMRAHGFLEERSFATARHIVARKNGSGKLVTIDKNCKVADAISTITKEGISQIPVTDGDNIVGSLSDSKILAKLIESPEIKDHSIEAFMDKPFTFVAMDNTVDVLSSLINKDNPALMVRDEENKVHIITQADLLTAMTS
jgi:cystathionine beta-synthase